MDIGEFHLTIGQFSSAAGSNLAFQIISTAVIALSTFLAVYFAFKLELKRKFNEEDEKVVRFLNAIRTEIETIREQYMGGIGNLLDSHQENAPFESIYPFLDYHIFPIYEQNTDCIPLIPDQNLSQSIVEFYSRSYGLLACFKYNNKLLSERFESEIIEDSHYRSIVKTKIDRGLQQYSITLIAWHKEALQKAADVLRRLDEYLGANNRPHSLP